MDDYRLLKNIKGPRDVKALREDELPELASEIRRKLITTLSSTGGHLASNLGVVELTIALHRVFNSPYDKIVWDVGHQCYTHKLLTGRLDRFDTLRQNGGISGFCNPDESEHDIFFSGHSSTSVSAAYGIAQANKLKGNKNYTVAVIGDGAFTGGMVYEALNNAGGERSRLIVILNDNDMSISRNVGSIAEHLAVIKARPSYFRMKAKTENALNHIPLIGVSLSNGFFRLKTALKRALYKKSTMFEELGFRYMGPVDGHNIDVLCDALEGAKTAHYPILLHIRTVKGKGCEFAESDPDIFHGISKFDAVTGEFHPSGKTFSSEFGDAALAFAENDTRICAVTAAMALGTGLADFAQRYPDRFFDVGIAEEHAVTFSAGLSRGGMVPVFAVYSAFLQRTYDQLVHDAALQRLRLVLVIDRAGFVAGDGETHHGLLDVPFLNTIPNVSIYSPSTYDEMRHDMYNAIYKDEGVTAVRIPKGEEPELPEGFIPGEGDFDVFGDEDADTAVVVYGRLYGEAVSAFRELASQGIKIKILKLNRIKPISVNMLLPVLKCRKIFFFEEGEKTGGVGESFNMLLTELGFSGGFVLRAVGDRFVHHSDIPALLAEFGLDSKGMTDLVAEDASDGG